MRCPKCHCMVLVEPPSSDSLTAAGPEGTDRSASHAQQKATAASAVAATIPEVPVPPPVSTEVALSQAEASPAMPPEPAVSSIPSLPTAPPTPWHKWLGLGTAATVGIMFAASIWMFAKARSTAEENPAEVNTRQSAQTVSKDEDTVFRDDTGAAAAGKGEVPPVDHVSSQADGPAVATGSPQDPLAVPPESNEVNPVALVNAAPSEPALATEVEPVDPQAAKLEQDPLLINEEPSRKPVENDVVAASQADADQVAAVTTTNSVVSRHAIPNANPDISSRLELQLNKIAFGGNSTFNKVLNTLADMTQVPIESNLVAFRQVGLSPASLVTYQKENVTVSEFLDSLLRLRGLAYVATGDHVIITKASSDSAVLREISYRLSDLADDGTELRSLAELVRKMVAPE
ncbi:MAG: STN domain-containing protein, partial [Planctomycetales bacterium]